MERTGARGSREKHDKHNKSRRGNPSVSDVGPTDRRHAAALFKVYQSERPAEVTVSLGEEEVHPWRVLETQPHHNNVWADARYIQRQTSPRSDTEDPTCQPNSNGRREDGVP
ncbi:hypothetical protein R1sor_019401 [Riccia sorocarpa]|uniref:Uncharacterized protein n=1 Tax=Riccia sorocarpa TaxID=122646 RepID=A0ABD3IE47_9MARC